jgi:hypothetical protein
VCGANLRLGPGVQGVVDGELQLELTLVELYGAAPAAAVEGLRREAAVAGASLAEFPAFLGGFLRAGRSGEP